MRIQIIENYELKTIQKCLTETKSNGYMNMMQQDLNEQNVKPDLNDQL